MVLLDRRRAGREWGGALSLRDMLHMLYGSEVLIKRSTPVAAAEAADRSPEEWDQTFAGLARYPARLVLRSWRIIPNAVCCDKHARPEREKHYGKGHSIRRAAFNRSEECGHKM